MTNSREQSMTIKDKVNNALERVVEQVVADGKVDVHLCTLELPEQFSEDQHQANGIYKRIQSDFCKSVMRRTGETPRYVTVRCSNAVRPEYAICLFTHTGLGKSEELMEKGLEIANGKALHAGWGRGKLDVVELIRDAPRFTISSQSITFTTENKDEAMKKIQTHLADKAENTQPHQRTMFVSKHW